MMIIPKLIMLINFYYCFSFHNILENYLTLMNDSLKSLSLTINNLTIMFEVRQAITISNKQEYTLLHSRLK